MILKRLMTISGIGAMATGFYRLFHPPQPIEDLRQLPELVQRSMDLTLVNMGLVLVGGVLILIAMAIRR
ncbi:MAG: hypothetical protein HQL99_04705 [Magnetococcales bacterium]|nr:hypothetical protein [Magnetococcales bacterium]